MTKKYLFIILILSFLTRFLFFGYPAEIVFDEVHFGKFIIGYFTHQYFFDIHPPLGKLLIASFAKITGFKPVFSFETIGQQYQDNSYKWLRFLPKLSGAIFPFLIFLLALELDFSQKTAFLAGIFTVFENSLIVQSRFILLDSLLLLFGFLSLLFFLKLEILKFKRSLEIKKKNLFLSGFFSSLALSIKWTGASFLLLCLIFYFSAFLRSDKKLKFFIEGVLFLIIIPLLLYFFIFVLHFSLLTQSGPGDVFHSPQFQKSLIGNRFSIDPSIQPLNIFQKFIELNKKIYSSNAILSATHPYSSKWFTWPLMIKPIYYWYKNFDQNQSAKIFFSGNILIWLLGTASVSYLIIVILRQILNEKIENQPKFLLVGYLLNFLPFIFIGRVMFLYHYLTALVFTILIFCYLIDKNLKGKFFYFLIFSAIIIFLISSPLTYGLKIPQWYLKIIFWI